MLPAAVKRLLGRNLMLTLGLGIVLFMSLAALCAPLIAPYPPTAQHLDNILEPPSSRFWLGTDRLGRDVFSRLLYGGRVSLWVGFVAVGISISIGTVLGLISGYFRRWVDEAIMRMVDIMLCFPSFFLILAVIAFLEPDLTNIMVVIGLTSWMGVTRLVRAEALSLREREFVAAARLAGSPTRRGRSHSGGVEPEFSGTGRTTTHGQLGQYAHGRQNRHRKRALALGLSGPGYSDHCTRL